MVVTLPTYFLHSTPEVQLIHPVGRTQRRNRVADGGNGHGVDGGHGGRLQRIFRVANEEGERETGVGSNWDTFSALLRPPDSNIPYSL